MNYQKYCKCTCTELKLRFFYTSERILIFALPISLFVRLNYLIFVQTNGYWIVSCWYTCIVAGYYTFSPEAIALLTSLILVTVLPSAGKIGHSILKPKQYKITCQHCYFWNDVSLLIISYNYTLMNEVSGT